MNNKAKKNNTKSKQLPIVIVGAGAAGIGIGITFKKLGLPFIIIDKSEVGASFKRWGKQTQFISPSFSGNAFGMIDLNSISPETSPAFTLKSEHPSGEQYATYLQKMAEHFKLPVMTGVTVRGITHDPRKTNAFTLDTTKGDMKCKYVVWAAGEYSYPNKHAFMGAQECTHYADVRNWQTECADDDTVCVIGGYESGVDAAYQLTKIGKNVVLFDGENKIKQHGSDSSYTLSPFSRDRLNAIDPTKIKMLNTYIDEVVKVEDGYEIYTEDNIMYKTKTPPINCTGFTSSLSVVKNMFEFEGGKVKLTPFDESTICQNLFLTGPQVQHGSALFCFIYKFRQRFGIVGKTLSIRMKGDARLRNELIDDYKNNNFYLEDLSCCDNECAC